ncbi:MAG: DNA-processing protein DprA [Candidatus Moraniibacteriota bacterium]
MELIPKSSPRFPKLLSEIPDAPPLLYVRGNFDFTKPQAMLAVVGARKHSAYGTRVTERLVFDLAKRGAVIVSGLAFGIDRLAHEVTLTAEGQTLSVLPGGLDDAGIAPRTHLALAHAITEHGALISEWAPGTEITPAHFPVRNRLIAGLCLGTLIIEAEEASGSLITASLATDYNRDVFAIPGPIFSSTSDGPNRLLQRGAKAILMAEDIFSEYAAFFEKVAGEKQAASNAEAFLTTEEERLVNCLGSEPMHIDTIIKISGLETGQVQSLLTLLELKGVAKNIGSMHYTRQ